MALFDDRIQVLKVDGVTVGEFDQSADGFYRNVMTFNFNVKKKKAIRVKIRSDNPVDVAVANENGSSMAHKQSMKDGELGPVPTLDNREMGLFLGVYPGDKATVSVEVWMEKP
ncbi:MAG: hypothetical protein LBR42_03905 [Candidatus Methanoplasma sp.]|nr:hypothetical protein [Candidatus Methanoplasma sp.]